jgi:hypothetical protein
MNQKICVTKKNTFIGVFILLLLSIVVLSTLALQSNQAKNSRASQSKKVALVVIPTPLPANCYALAKQICMYPTYQTLKNNHTSIISVSLILKQETERNMFEALLKNSSANMDDQFAVVNYYWDNGVQKSHVIKQLSLGELKRNKTSLFTEDISANPQLKQMLENYENRFVMYYVSADEFQKGSTQAPSSCVEGGFDENCVPASKTKD